jgi:hypothetical protein
MYVSKHPGEVGINEFIPGDNAMPQKWRIPSKGKVRIQENSIGLIEAISNLILMKETLLLQERVQRD